MARIPALALCLIALSATGCVSVRSSHGYVLERGETELTAKVGIDTMESVIAKYGEPSVRGTFDDRRWYYLASFDQARAFFKPKITAREVVAFEFDETGKVVNVERLDVNAGLDLKMVSRETPTRGKELSFWEQLLGNVGQLPAGGIGGPQGPGQ